MLERFFFLKLSMINYEDAIRRTDAWDGDSGTVVAITGSITEVLWGIQQEIYSRIFDYLDTEPK